VPAAIKQPGCFLVPYGGGGGLTAVVGGRYAQRARRIAANQWNLAAMRLADAGGASEWALVEEYIKARRLFWLKA
jgi:hypothetical protein